MLAPSPDWYGTVKKKPTYTQADIDASLAANPQASTGGYVGPAQWLEPWNTGGGAAAPSAIHLPGVDYGALIGSDPNLLAGSADVAAMQSQIEKQRQDAIRTAVIRSGFIPGSVADVDQSTIDAAKANQFSTAAELERSRGRSTTDLQAQLAARGILGSGALAGGQQRIQEGYERGTTLGVQGLLDQISGVESSTASQRYQLQQQIAQLREAAAQRIASDPRYQQLGPTDAVLDPGSGLYVTPDGRWYRADGSRADAPAQTSSAPAAAAPTPAATSNQEWLAKLAAATAQGSWTAGF